MDQFNRNFEHLDRVDAYEAFERHDTLYQDMRVSIERCAEMKIELRALSREIAIYIQEDLLSELNIYLKSTNFTFTTDGIGLFINTYGRSFFENLLDDSNLNMRRSAYDKIMKGLRNVKH